MYTLGGGIDTERGWGRTRRDLARQGGARGVRRRADLVRARRPGPRHPPGAHPDARGRLPAVARSPRRCARAGSPGSRLLPMTDDRVETHVVVDDPDEPSRPAGHALPGVLGAPARRGPGPRRGPVGLDESTPGPGVLEAIADADVVLLPPSNPVVSVGTILGVPGIRDALRATAAPVVGLSPDRRRAPVRGMADQLLAAIGVEVTRRGGGRALRRPQRPAGCSTAGWSTPPTPTDVDRVGAAGIACRGRAADDDRPRRHGRDGAAALDLGRGGPRVTGPHRRSGLPVDGVGEVAPGDDLAGAARAAPLTCADGDILVVTSKVVSKAEGRVRTGEREEAIADETDRVGRPARADRDRAHPARAGDGRRRHRRVEHRARHRGAAAPSTRTRSARRLREALARRTGRNVAVLVTDTAGRAWRTGQTDIAIGAAGLDVLQDYAMSPRYTGGEATKTCVAHFREFCGPGWQQAPDAPRRQSSSADQQGAHQILPVLAC